MKRQLLDQPSSPRSEAITCPQADDRDTLPTVQHGHSVVAWCLAGVLITGQISPQEVGVIWGAMGHCHGSPGQSGEQSPQLPAGGAFGVLTGTLTAVH